MLEQSATVVETSQRKLVVEVIPQTSCQSCSVNKGCGTAVLSNTVGRKLVRFELDNTIDARVGDRVVLGVPEDAVVNGSLLMYLMPLLVMILAALLADSFVRADDPARDIIIALAALSGLGASVLLGRLFIRPSGSSYQPVLLRKDIAVGEVAGSH